MIKQIPFLLLPLLPLPAMAEGYLITPLAEGGIQAVSVTSVTDWVLAQGFEGLTLADTDKATGIILEEGKPPRLVFDPLEVIDRRYGGDGAVDLSNQTIFLGDLDAEPDQPVVIPLDDIPEGVPIELFEGDGPVYITLRDGLWRSTMTDQSQAGCPPQLAPMIEGLVGSGSTVNAQFSSPYHPTDFSDQLGFATWLRVSPNGFVSKPFNPAGAAGMPPGMDFKIQYGMVAVSPERLDVWSRVELTLPAMMAALTGGSSTCIAEGRGNYSYVGP